MKQRKVILTGSYLKNYIKTTQDNPCAYPYSEKFNSSPKPLGGAYLILTPEYDCRNGTVRDGAANGPTRLLRIQQETASSLDFVHKMKA